MTKQTELIDLARKQFSESPGWELGVRPDSIMDVHRRLADALERAEAVIAEASESLRRYADRDVAIGILAAYQNGADHD